MPCRLRSELGRRPSSLDTERSAATEVLGPAEQRAGCRMPICRRVMFRSRNSGGRCSGREEAWRPIAILPSPMPLRRMDPTFGFWGIALLPTNSIGRVGESLVSHAKHASETRQKCQVRGVAFDVKGSFWSLALRTAMEGTAPSDVVAARAESV